ncbi:hypothetical protein MNBD_NITROSPIRAE03-1292 [hydrothermal vent metagenome]|uniref:Uncharacterized protein n=1 Tax=hydrothermal vent metagenome TaxID=652676 RepID=A0A3B1CVS6_9ZZZZ
MIEKSITLGTGHRAYGAGAMIHTLLLKFAMPVYAAELRF